MDPYTARGEARIRQRDIASAERTGPFMAAASLAALERHRGWQAEAELDRLLKQHGVTPPAGSPLVALLRRTIGRALVRAGERLAGAPRSGVSLEPTPAPGTLSTAS